MLFSNDQSDGWPTSSGWNLAHWLHRERGSPWPVWTYDLALILNFMSVQAAGTVFTRSLLLEVFKAKSDKSRPVNPTLDLTKLDRLDPNQNGLLQGLAVKYYGPKFEVLVWTNWIMQPQPNHPIHRKMKNLINNFRLFSLFRLKLFRIRVTTSAVFLPEEFPHRRGTPFPFSLRQGKNDGNYMRSVFFLNFSINLFIEG